MNKYLLYLGFFLLSLPVTPVAAQKADVGIGQWRVHLPYNLGKSVAENGQKVYCASVSGLFSFLKEDGSVKRISRIEGLSDFEIHEIRYSTAANVLIIAYENSNIDLLYDDGKIVNLSDIKRKNINGNKSINDIYFKDRYAYLACGFGIVLLDLDKQEIKDTYYIGPNGAAINVNGVCTDNASFYAATDSGVYKAAVNDPLIYFFSAWSKDTTLPLPNEKYTSIASFNNWVFTVDRDTVLQHDNSSGWAYFNTPKDNKLKLMADQRHLVIRNSYSIGAYDITLNRTHFSASWDYSNGNPLEAIVDANGIMFIADGNNGLVRDAWSSYTTIYPNGPSGIASVSMASLNDDVWVATGAISSLSACSPTYSRSGMYHYTDNTWNSFYRLNSQLFDTIGFPDVMDVVCDPADSKRAYVAGWGGGILEFYDKQYVQRYAEDNSTLRGLRLGTYNPILVGGVTFDSENNLWAMNTGYGIQTRRANGTWKGFPFATTVAQACFGKMLVDDNGYKWFIINSQGIGVFYENDIDNPNDNQFKILTQGAGLGNLPTKQIFSMVKDKDNTIWIGSENGVAAFYSPQNVFDANGFDAQQVLIQQGAYTQILLQSQNVTAIAVDGANRKWFGTSSGGVFLTSPDGTSQLLNFNTDNSPLLSNNITSICINQLSGEVFFGTDKGICSYRGTATEGGDVCDNYYVYPNPVKHEYSGLIAVRGLVGNARVKITDISGNVVYETTANGGQATWDGNNYRKERAQTGVYLVFVSNDDGSSTCVTKFLMVN